MKPAIKAGFTPSAETAKAYMRQLLEYALQSHRRSDHPVIATLIGKWLGERYEEHQFIAQPRLIFEAADVSDIVESNKPERF